jgi:hypothetical protein
MSIPIHRFSKALKNPLSVSGERVGDFRLFYRRQPCSPRAAVVMMMVVVTRMATMARTALIFVIPSSEPII